jgi:nucleotide-binding universal stress UspA family protein
MILAVRPLLSRLARYHEERGQITTGMLAMLFVGIILSALITDRIGIHAIFGAFLFGAIMPQRSEFISELVQKLEDFTVVFLLPLFFAFTGLRTDIGLLGSSGALWGACGLVLLVAIVGKWGGSSFVAKALGMGWRESMALGVLMNTRGLTELIILNIGLDLKVIPPALFAILVIMALVTTFMTTPLLSAFYSKDVMDRMVAEASDDEVDEGQRRMTIVVPVGKLASAGPLVHTAMRLVDEGTTRLRIVLLRPVQSPGSAFRAGPRVHESMMARATQSLKPLVELVQGAGHEAIPVVVPGHDVAQTIVDTAEDREADLILLSYQRPLWGNRVVGGIVGDVLRDAPCDVAVVVDPSGKGVNLPKGARIVVPHGGGFHEDVGFDLALRLATSAGATISLLGPADDEGARQLGQRAARGFEERGVWVVPEAIEGDPSRALLEHARNADLVVLGVGDEWIRDKESLGGGLRQAIAARATAPLLIVRRAGQRSARLRRPKDWISGQADSDVVGQSVTA